MKAATIDVLVAITVSADTPLYFTLQVKPDISRLIPVKVRVLLSVYAIADTAGNELVVSV